MHALINELKTYYSTRRFRDTEGGREFNPFREKMDAYAHAHPGASALELKTAQYEIIADHFTPVVFRNTPFFSEMGVRFAEYDGTGAGAGAWLMRRNSHLWRELDPEMFQQHSASAAEGFHISYGPYIDPDHHCFPFTAALRNGLEFFHEEYGKGEQNTFTASVRRTLVAVKKIAEKFADAAEKAAAGNELERGHLKRIAEAARRVPWKRPESFYEGLAALWFLHEVCASIDGVGMSVIGRPDYLLKDLYERDLASGRLTRDGAYDLICRFMVHTDCKLDLDRPLREQYNRGEQGDTLILGGCDEQGNEVCNELTFLFLRAHRELKLIYPKIHCRYSAGSSPEFLDAANLDFLNGRNTVSFLNDDVLIPAQVKAGKALADARGYVAGGCWEVMVEGCEHAQGANCYFNLARIMDVSIHDSAAIEASTGMVFRKLDGAGSFEEVYDIVVGNATRAILKLCERLLRGSRAWSEVNPAPFFSACLKDCLENRRDYSAGGARYRPHGIPLGGLAVLTDSLSAIRRLCFEEALCSLAELLEAVRADWNGFEPLRLAAVAAPRFGDGKGSERLAARILSDIVSGIREFNERNPAFRFQPGLYNYRDIIDWAENTRATPDGRKKGDFLTQGMTPSRASRHLDAATVFSSCAALPLVDFPANSVLTLSLQRMGMTPKLLAAAVRSCPAGMLQLNCIDRAELLDAVEHPEQHGDLVVRLYGYSARFVSLDGKMQEEFLTRAVL